MRIGDLTVEELIGEGGFGKVYRACTAAGGAVAVKVSNVPTAKLSSQELGYQQNELEVLMRLHHPSLVGVLGHGFLDDGRLYLLMELVNGTRLDAYCRDRGRLDALEAVRIVEKIADALAYCHHQDVLHLDLKPNNIVITDAYAPAVKVLDFGLARLSDAGLMDLDSIGAGTVQYMAPECFEERRPRLGPKIDIYALGAIFYELLAGAPAYQLADLSALIRAKLSYDPVPLEVLDPGIPKGVTGLVGALLRRDVERRYPSAALLSARLKDVYYAILHGGPDEVIDGDVMSGSPTGRDVPFVGRTRELALLGERLAEARCGRGHAVAVVGEAGIGKTRLLGEFVSRSVHVEPTLVGYGRCRQLGELVPYAPLREALAQVAHAVESLPALAQRQIQRRIEDAMLGDAALLGELVPELHRPTLQNGRGVRRPSTIRPSGAARVAGAAVHLLTELAREVSVVLVIEDLHWMDEGMLRVLSVLSRELAGARVLLLGSSRPEARARVDELGMRVILVEALAKADNDALLAALTGSSAKEDLATLQRAVPLLSAGSPLLITQVVANLELEGYLSRSHDGPLWLSPRIHTDYVPPDSVSRVLKRTLCRLDPSVTRVLGVAALLGRQFSVALLPSLGLMGEDEVRAALARAEQLYLCRITADCCTFVHHTIREELEATVAEAERPDIHRRIARRLEEQGQPPGARAYHLSRAGESQAAAEAYLMAGLASYEQHDPAGAAAHLGQASRLLTALPPSSERGDLLMRTAYELVRVACLLGQASDILQHLDTCAAMLGEPSPAQAAALFSSYARIYYAQGNFPKALEHSVRCLETVKEEPSLRQYQYIPSNIMGRALSAMGKFGPAAEVLTTACELAQEAEEYTELSHSEGLLGTSLAYMGRYEEAWERIHSSARLADQLKDPVRTLGSLFYYAALCEASCQWDMGIVFTTRLLASAEKTSLGGLYLYLGTMFAGRHQFHVGRPDRARVLLLNAVNLSARFHIATGVGWAYAFLGDACFVTGALREAEDAYRRGMEVALARTGDAYAAPLCQVGLAHLGALCGQAPGEVRRLAEEGLRQLEEVSNLATCIIAEQRYAEALEALGELEDAAQRVRRRGALVEELEPGEPDFWPRVPDIAAERHQSRRVFWSRLRDPEQAMAWKEAVGSSLTLPLGAVMSGLLDKISTEVGYMPTLLTM
ncbi:protein kinase [Sorangium sp. So ce321]|uniref:serine/threonine-protein kinase n=1 Tax=Sorangium sp. So ce321 TaxID=3133300 RepID=UPI003F632C25